MHHQEVVGHQGAASGVVAATQTTTPVRAAPDERIEAAFEVDGTPLKRHQRALQKVQLVNQRRDKAWILSHASRFRW